MNNSKKMVLPKNLPTTKGSAVSLKPTRPTPPPSSSSSKPSNSSKQGKSNGNK